MKKTPTTGCRRSFGIQFAFVAVASILLCVNISSAAFTVGDWTPIYQGVWVASGYDTAVGTAVYAIRVDTAHPAVSMFATAHSGSLETTKQTTPGFMSYYACEAAINANFFEPASREYPEANNWGLVISNGSVVSTPQEAGFISQLRITSDNVATLADDWGYPAGIHTAVGGGYFLLLAGENYGEVLEPRARSAIGLTQDGRFIILAVADGGGGSPGGSTIQMSYWIEAFGAYYAFNCDGGGSSCICTASGGVLNHPSEGTPRPVGTNLGVNSSTYNPRMDCWVIGNSDGAVKKKNWTKSASWTSSWGDYGAPACGIDPVNGVTAVSRGPNLIDLFVIGNDNRIYRKAYNGSSWGSWDFVSNLPSGVSCSSGLDACSWGINRMDVVFVGNDGHLYRKTAIIGSGWESVVDQGGTLKTDEKPTIVAWGPNRLDIFASDADGDGIMHKRYNGSSWSAWEELDGNPYYGLDAVSSSYGKVHVFYTTSAGKVYRRTYDDNGTWSGATDLGGNFNSAPGAVSYEPGQLMVFCRDASTGACWKRNYDNLSWGSWSSALGGVIIGAPDGSSWSNDAGTHLP